MGPRTSLRSWPAWPLLAIGLMSLAATARAGEIGFAYADASGQRLLAPPDLAAPQAIRQALCPGNELVNVRFLRTQTGDRKRSPGRDAAEDSAHQPGQVFTLTDSEIGESDACLVAPAEFFRAREPLPLETRLAREEERDACSEVLRGRVASARARPVAGCWPLADLDEQDSVYVLVFVGRGADRLAALVLDHGGQLTFHDYPARAADRSSALRADDGSFDPGAFDVLFAVEGPQGIELGVEWLGPEGSNLQLLQAVGARFRERLAAYFHRAP